MICRCSQRFAFTVPRVDFLRAIDYWRCDGCGFTNSPSYLEMTQPQFDDMNRQAHEYLSSGENPVDPRWMERIQAQAELINWAADRQRLIVPRRARWLDHACGDGTLAELLGCQRYDRERFPWRPARTDGYSLVVSTSAFEHFRTRDELDEVAGYVMRRMGVLALHTMVRERIPDDPTWFYLLPGHCSLFTNRAMTRLFNDWGFRSSSYHVAPRMWFWFRHPDAARLAALADKRRSNQAAWSRSFAAYWRE